MRRLPYLDSLRGLAAIYVVFYHATLLPSPHLLVPHWLSPIVMLGGSGVTLFFVVSAFSLCLSIRGEPLERSNLLDFYGRRFFRIAPLFYAMILFYLVRDKLYFGAVHSVAEILENFFFIFNFIPGRETGFVWASWTIGVEMIFYAIFPFLFHRLRGVWDSLAGLFAALLLVIVYREIMLHLPIPDELRGSYVSNSFMRNLPIFMLGLVVYRLYERLIVGRVVDRSIGAALIMLSLFAYSALIDGALNLFFADGYYWQAVIYSTLLIGLAINPHRFIVNRITEYLGKISYSVYLLHPSTILFLFPVYTRIYGTGLPISVKFLASMAITLGIVIAAASLTYRFIELPGMRIGKRFLASRHAGAALRASA